MQAFRPTIVAVACAVSCGARAPPPAQACLVRRRILIELVLEPICIANE
jgi:hypothetical protein